MLLTGMAVDSEVRGLIRLKCKLSPVRRIGDNDFLRVISWACWYYHPLLVLVNYLLCYVAIYIC